MGLFNDVTEGVSELIKYGNVGGLIRNVTHGVSNSAAKVNLSSAEYFCLFLDNVVVEEAEYFSKLSLFLCVSSQGLSQMVWGRRWTTDIRVSESTSDTMEQPVESTW